MLTISIDVAKAVLCQLTMLTSGMREKEMYRLKDDTRKLSTSEVMSEILCVVRQMDEY